MKSNIGQLSFYWFRKVRLHQFRFAVILKRPLKSFTLIFFKMCLLRSLRCDLTFSQWVDKWHFQASTVNNRKFSSASILNINNFLRLYFFFLQKIWRQSCLLDVQKMQVIVLYLKRHIFSFPCCFLVLLWCFFKPNSVFAL